MKALQEYAKGIDGKVSDLQQLVESKHTRAHTHTHTRTFALMRLIDSP